MKETSTASPSQRFDPISAAGAAVVNGGEYKGSTFDRTGQCCRDGLKAESVFATCVAAREGKDKDGWACRAVSAERNMMEHTDFEVRFGADEKWHRVDVKARKRVERGDDEAQDDLVWLEIKGPCPTRERSKKLGWGHSNDGWIYGSKAPDYVAFETPDAFLLVPNAALRELIESKVRLDLRVGDAGSALYKVYSERCGVDKTTRRRYFKWEKTTLVNVEDIVARAEHTLLKLKK
jgi:hypothetical protein